MTHIYVDTGVTVSMAFITFFPRETVQLVCSRH